MPSKAVLEAEREELSAEDLIKVYTSAMHPDSASPVAGPEAEALHGQMQREMAAAKKAAGGRAILWEVPSL